MMYKYICMYNNQLIWLFVFIVMENSLLKKQDRSSPVELKKLLMPSKTRKPYCTAVLA